MKGSTISQSKKFWVQDYNALCATQNVLTQPSSILNIKHRWVARCCMLDYTIIIFFLFSHH